MSMSSALEGFSKVEVRLPRLVELCKEKLSAEQVWLFGSRARGDHRDDSDWDILAVVHDEAPDEVMDPVRIWKVGRESGVLTDLLTVKMSEFIEAQGSVTTISHIARREGVRLDQKF